MKNKFQYSGYILSKFFLLTILISVLTVSNSCKTKKQKIAKNDIEQNQTESKKESTKTTLSQNEMNNANRLVNNDQNNISSVFAFNSFKQISNQKSTKNFSYSPVSLKLAMSMVYAGSETQTREEISRVFNFNIDNQIFLNEMGRYYSYLQELQKDTNHSFSVTNKIFLEQTYKVLDSYINNIKMHFGGSFDTVDFIKNYSEQEKLINAWVEQKTKNRIKELIPKGTLSEITRLVLVNTLYLKSNWLFEFNKYLTTKKPFYYTKDKTAELDFMTQKPRLMLYYENSRFQVLELPYSNRKLSLLIVLPKKSNFEEISTFIPDEKEYLNIISNLKSELVNFEIPKFKIESDFDLVSLLQNMGIKVSFTDNADFSGISKNRDLKISNILQKVFFEIDEKGTEAAAATAIMMVLTSAGPSDEKKPKNFIANRPFIFVLKENKYNTPLFVGQFVNPIN